MEIFIIWGIRLVGADWWNHAIISWYGWYDEVNTAVTQKAAIKTPSFSSVIMMLELLELGVGGIKLFAGIAG